ncbi:MAG: NAD(P)H-hydrate dehydratase, partial [Clostridia bacterium]|nr:NAD(P)H-hydrate dehydratase [Clostridia bacterium]
SSQSAVTAGSGLVTLAVPSSLNLAMEAKTTEVMTCPVEDISGHISFGAEDRILELLKKSDAVLIGPGLGRSVDAVRITESVLSSSKVPVIIDADGINAVARNMDVLRKCTCPVIFTPHTAEMSRLTGLDADYIEENRLVVSKEFADEYGATVILKGHHTIVTAGDGTQYINITGNSGLATGGSGDVLAGILASFVARGINEPVAAAMAVYIHGTAGDIAKEKYGIESVTATKIMRGIPYALRQILQVEKR